MERDAVPRRAWALLAGIAGVGLMGASMAVGAGGGGDPGEWAAGRLGVAALVSSLGLACIAAAGALGARRTLADGLALHAGRLSPSVLAGVVIGAVGLSHVVDAGLHGSGLRGDGMLDAIEALLLGAHGWGLALAVIGIGLGAGIAEELLFRGLVLRLVWERWGLAVAVAVSSLLFGALHLDPVQAVAAVVLGLYLAGVAVAAGSTRASIVCHVVNNVAAVLTVGAGDTAWWSVPLAALAAALGIGMLLRAFRPGAGQPIGMPVARSDRPAAAAGRRLDERARLPGPDSR